MRPARFLFASILCLSLVLTSASAFADSPTFRGPDRDGIFDAQGLAKSWPENGPKLLWAAEGLGEGYSSLAIADGKIITTGSVEQQGSVLAFDLQGKLLWKTPFGKEHSGNGYPGSRTTPSTDGELVFIHTSMGHAVALNFADGNIVWQKDLLKEYGGENIYFGVSESPLIDGDRVIFTAGGKNASLVALDKTTGKLVWRTQGLSEVSAYCAPMIFDNGKIRQIITLVQKSLVGVDPESGKVVWTHDFPATYDIHSTSPVFEGNMIYVSHGYDQGGKAFKLADDGESVKEVWSEAELDIHHGGAVLVDGVIYGAASKKSWYALDLDTGKISATLKRLGKGAVVYADGLLYGYVESGDVLLVNPDPQDFRVISEFKMKAGEGHHWAHPVIEDGVLYIRHGDVLHAYDIKAPAADAKASAAAEGP